MTELTDEDHACLTFGEPEELADLTAAFIRDGLAGGLKVMWLSDTSAGASTPNWPAAASTPGQPWRAGSWPPAPATACS